MSGSILTEKFCPFCMETKPTADFHKCKALRDGLSNRCKACVKVYSAENKERIRTRNKEWKLKNRERINAERRAQRASKSEAVRARRKGGHESITGVALRDKPVLIYGLIDPRNNELRYVGKTENNLLARLRSHVHRAVVERPTLHVSRWLATMISDGVRPEIMLLETVPIGGDWIEAECFWIEAMRALGCRMTNLTPGGDFGGVPTPEYRERLSRAMKGRIITPEARAKISEANKGRKLTDETREKIAEASRARHQRDKERKLSAQRSLFTSNSEMVSAEVSRDTKSLLE